MGSTRGRAERLLKVSRISGSKRSTLRALVTRMSIHDTPDTRALVDMLKSPRIKFLMQRAESIVPLSGVDLSEVKRDLNYDIMNYVLEASDYTGWISTQKSWLSSLYCMKRLQWLWEASWTYHLFGEDVFGRNGLLIYSYIRGPRPRSLGQTLPFQPALNKYRKDLIKKRERSIYLAAKHGDYSTLVDFGLSEDAAKHAIAKVGYYQ